MKNKGIPHPVASGQARRAEPVPAEGGAAGQSSLGRGGWPGQPREGRLARPTAGHASLGRRLARPVSGAAAGQASLLWKWKISFNNLDSGEYEGLSANNVLLFIFSLYEINTN